MTAYRHPFNRKNQTDMFERPPLQDWIQAGLDDYENKTRSQKHTLDYWHQLYWATPPWLSDEQIKQMKAIYNSANPKTCNIDHIVPLNNPLVCGLNVPWNLQKMRRKHNLHKSNNWWPGAPILQNSFFDLYAEENHQLQLC